MPAKNCTGKFEFKPGDRFGRLEVVAVAGKACPSRTKWLCRCDCGADTVTLAASLASGATQSCGCRYRELAAERMRKMVSKHGDRYTREYSIWHGMKARCLNPNDAGFKWYGGRNIRVCDAWRDSYEAFLAGMGRAPTAQHSLDRIDTNGDYSPENCRWATHVEQANNTRVNRRVEYQGVSYTMAELARKAGFNKWVLRQRIVQRGWAVEKAVETPVRGKR